MKRLPSETHISVITHTNVNATKICSKIPIRYSKKCECVMHKANDQPLQLYTTIYCQFLPSNLLRKYPSEVNLNQQVKLVSKSEP